MGQLLKASSDDDMCVEVLGILANLNLPEVDFQKMMTELDLLPYVIAKLKVCDSKFSGYACVRLPGQILEKCLRACSNRYTCVNHSLIYRTSSFLLFQHVTWKSRNGTGSEAMCKKGRST